MVTIHKQINSKMILIFLFVFQLYSVKQCCGMKYTCAHFEKCKHCEEKSKLFYEILNTNSKLCPKCMLEHLSFNFAQQELKEIKFYMKDIIHHHISDPQNFTWDMISATIDALWGQKFFKKRKKEKKNCDLFVMINYLVNVDWRQCPFTRKVCSLCLEGKMSVIKTQCCKKRICIRCYLDLKNEKCRICKKKFCQNKQELLKSLCLIVCKIMRVEITKDIANEFDIIVYDIFVKTEQQNILPTLQQVESVIKYYNSEIVIPWESILTPQLQPGKNMIMPGTKCLCFLMATTFPVQIVFFSSPTDIPANINWMVLNELLALLIVAFHDYFPMNADLWLPNKIDIKIEYVFRIRDIFLLTWSNVLLGYFYFGPNFYERFELLFFIFVFSVPFLWSSHIGVQKKYDEAIQRTLYDFY